MYGSLDISTSGMIAQRTRQTAIAANIAGRGVNVDANGNFSPFRERQVMLAAGNPGVDGGLGVRVSEIHLSNAEFNTKYEPGHPFAHKDGPKAGFVDTDNVDPFKQHIDLLDATRAYEANIGAAEATKMMTSSMLRLLA